jgi:hypothetical protein
MSHLESEQRRSRRAQRKHGKAVKRKKRQSALQTETEQQREERLAKGRAERRQLRQRLAEDDDAVLTFKEWCALNTVSERQGRRILAEPGGPTVTMLSDKRIGISRRHNREWQQARARG